MDRLLLKYQHYPFTVRLAFILVLAGLFAYWNYTEAVIPAQESVVQAKAQSDKLVEDIKRVNVADKKAEETERKIQDTEKELNEMRELLPSDLDTEKLLRAFADNAKEVGVEINKFTPDSQMSQDKSSQMGFMPPAVPPQSNLPGTSGSPGSKGTGAGGGASLSSSPSPQVPGGGNTLGMTPSAPAGLEGFHETEVALEVSGSFSQIVEFIDKALSMQRILKLKSVDYARAPDNAAPGDGSLANIQQMALQARNPRLNAKVIFVSFIQVGQDDVAARLLQNPLPNKPASGRSTGAAPASSSQPPHSSAVPAAGGPS